MKFEKLDSIIRNELALIPWTNVYGVARSLIAFSTLTLFALNDHHYVFRANLSEAEVPLCNGDFAGISLFCILCDHMGVAYLIAIAILLLVVIGWRPRYTGILHWWVNFSLITSAPLIDGGEHAATIISLLLIPLTLTDSRKWHWSEFSPPAEPSTSFSIRQLTALFSYHLVRVQVAVIYLHAAFGKCEVEEWKNGTAVYYWFNDPVFGAPAYLMTIIEPLIQNPVTVVAITWGTIVLEFSLFAALFMKGRPKQFMLALGILFHVAIAFIHGLATFSIVMIGALILFLHPLDQKFSFTFSLRRAPLRAQ